MTTPDHPVAPGPVLLHGFTGSTRSWGRPVAHGLSEAGLVPAPFELPGHGRRRGEVAPELFTLDATLSALSSAFPGRFDVVGYSMGGRIALHYAAAYPERVRRLVLESASPGLAEAARRSERVAEDEDLATSLEDEGIAHFVDEWEARPMFASRSKLPSAVVRLQREYRLKNDPRSLAAALRGLGAGSLPSLWGRLSTIRAPTLLLVGALDPKFVEIAERMALSLPNARLTTVSAAGHTVHLERPDEWVTEVAGFLSAP